jgi:hypothetical protein
MKNLKKIITFLTCLSAFWFSSAVAQCEAPSVPYITYETEGYEPGHPIAISINDDPNIVATVNFMAPNSTNPDYNGMSFGGRYIYFSNFTERNEGLYLVTFKYKGCNIVSQNFINLRLKGVCGPLYPIVNYNSSLYKLGAEVKIDLNHESYTVENIEFYASEMPDHEPLSKYIDSNRIYIPMFTKRNLGLYIITVRNLACNKISKSFIDLQSEACWQPPHVIIKYDTNGYEIGEHVIVSTEFDPNIDFIISKIGKYNVVVDTSNTLEFKSFQLSDTGLYQIGAYNKLPYCPVGGLRASFKLKVKKPVISGISHNVSKSLNNINRLLGSANELANASLSIFDLSGRLIFKTAVNDAIDISLLNNGLYIYHLNFENGEIERGKFLIED